MKLTDNFQALTLTNPSCTIQNVGNAPVEIVISTTTPTVKGDGIILYNKGQQHSIADIGTGNKVYLRSLEATGGYANFLNFI